MSMIGVSAAFAAPITVNCGTVQVFSGGVGSATVTCGALDAGAGFKLVNLFLTESSDSGLILSLGTGGSTTARVVYSTPTAPGTFLGTVGTYNITGSTVGGGSNAVPTSPQNTATSNFGSNTQTLGSFDVLITASLPNGGSVTQSTGRVQLTYDTMSTATVTPEPATLTLMGSALLGLGLLSRRRK